MTYVRWFGVAFAVISILTQVEPGFPSETTKGFAWGFTALLAVGSLLIWGTLARVVEEPALRSLGRTAFALDTIVICGFVWVFAFEDPSVTWALLFLVPLEGALRYRMKGALGGAGFVAVFFLAQIFHISDVTGMDPPLQVWIFVVGMATLVGGVTGTMAENWYANSLAFQNQTVKLAELDRLKDRYLAVTSHEIRGPLTAVIAGIQMLQRRNDRLSEDKRKEMVDMIASQSQQLARLVNDLMLSSELQAGSLSLDPEWVDLEPVVKQALEAAASKRKKHRLEIFIEPLRCYIDPSRVGQLVRNLVENAYKYTPENTRVAVTAKQTGGGILLEVADDGPGIPADKRDQLFEAFSRIEETSAGQEGVGLGLFVVSQLVNAMDGRIDFSSSLRGTTFGIHVPCDTERLAHQPQLGLVRGGGEAG
ncbi:MAG: two-component system, OmpR family, sensor histidine kinase KdpD [Actinomycetota bacterium]|jgi:signal transduction histidine kinase|nr:two-component system, OmpR family, sensor histidine kinase KdpD [Actinomycetota bacterium]